MRIKLHFPVDWSYQSLLSRQLYQMLVVTPASHEPLSQIICPEAAGGFHSD